MSRPKSRYVPALDGLRAFAVLAVIAYHMNMPWAPGGLLGVTMFFVLSGYLITGLLLAEFDYSGTIDLKDFWLRRVRRIIPAVFFCLVGVAALCTVFNHALLTKMRPDILPTALFFNNWWQIFHNVSYFQALGAPSPITHCWSLSIEEQFYLIWPVFLLIGLRHGMRKSTLRKVTAVLIVVSALLMAILFNPTEDPSRVYYGTDTRAFSLLIGALLAMVWPYSKLTDASGAEMSPQGRLLFDGVGLAALVGLVLMVMFTNGFAPFIYRGGLVICSILTALAMAVMVHPVSILGKLFGLKPLVWIGKLSYSLYLWHYPVLLLTTPGNPQSPLPWWMRLIQLALMFGITWVSYKFIEDPIRHGAIGRFVGRLRAGQIDLPTWTRSHVVGCSLAGLLVVVSAAGCAFVPDTNALEGAALLQNENAQTNAGPAGANGEADEGDSQPAVQPYSIVMIGDSVSVRAIPYFDERFPHGLIDAQVNRQFYSAEDLYGSYADQGLVGNVVVFALGTNGTVTDDQVDSLVKAVGEDKHIWFVNTRADTDWQDATNEALANATRYDNVRLIDWYALSAEHPEYFDEDGTHLGDAGAQYYVQMVYDAVKDYLPPEDEAADSADASDDSSGDA